MCLLGNLDEKRLDELPDRECVYTERYAGKADESPQKHRSRGGLQPRFAGRLSVTDGAFAPTNAQLAGFHVI